MFETRLKPYNSKEIIHKTRSFLSKNVKKILARRKREEEVTVLVCKLKREF